MAWGMCWGPGVSISVAKQSEPLKIQGPFPAILKISSEISVCYAKSKLETQNASKDEGDFE